MMNFGNLRVCFLLIIFIQSAFASAPPQWKIIPQESYLRFTATQNNAPITGEFKKFSGQIFVDPANYAASHVSIVVDMNSLSTSYDELTSTLDNADWFNVKLFPQARFEAQKFVKLNDNQYEAHGTLTIKNQSAPVILRFTAQTKDKKVGEIIGETRIKRLAFSVGSGEWTSTEEIKDEVLVQFKVVAEVQSKR